MTTYLLHTSILLAGFVLFYWFILRQETYFKLNRWILMAGIFCCLTIPTIEVPQALSLRKNIESSRTSVVHEFTFSGELQNYSSETNQLSDQTTKSDSISNGRSSTLPWKKILLILCIVGIVIFLLVFLLQIVVLLTQRHNLNSFKTGRYTIVEMVKDTEPCSFLNYIYINPGKYDEETYNHIIEHEKTHIDQSHFIDKIIAELLVVLFWFNPFTWLLRKSISQNLEFLTDKSLLNQGIQKEPYQMSLLKVSVSNRPLNLTASYNASFLKNRVRMMNAKNSSITAAWKYLFILPLFALSMASLNAVQSDGKEQSITVPVDKSSGQYDNNWDKDIHLQLENNPNHISRTVKMSTISKIALQISANVEISRGDEQKVTITGPEDLINMISTVVADENWQIKYTDQKPRMGAEQISIRIQIKDLTHLALSGRGNLITTSRFSGGNELYLALSGTGYIKAMVDAQLVHTALSGTGNIDVSCQADKAFIALSGSGNINITGTARDVEMVSSGSGNVNGIGIKSQTATITSDGSSTMSVYATDFLNVTAGGNSVVSYKGSPGIEMDVQSEARLQHVN